MDQQLTGGQNVASIVRRGNFVHRTPSKHPSFTRALFQHLQAQDFPFSPRFLGTDELDRDILSFIPGEVPRDIELSNDQQIACIKMLRQFHDATANFPLRENQEVICHNDFAPWNIIVHRGEVTGIIDFDDAAPGTRVDDIAYFIWTFLELGTTGQSDEQVFTEIQNLLAAYAVKKYGEFVPALLRQQQRILEFRQQLVLSTNKDNNLKSFSLGAIARIKKSMQWVHKNHNILTEISYPIPR